MNPQQVIKSFNEDMGKIVREAYKDGYRDGYVKGQEDAKVPEGLKDAYESDCWGHYER